MRLIFSIRYRISLLYNFFYWNMYNFRYNTKIYNYSLSRAVKPGKHVMIRKGVEIGREFSIGDYSYVSGPISYIESAHIGKYCSIARQTVIGVGNHNYKLVTTHPIAAGLLNQVSASPQKSAPIIGNDVWIGINTVVMRGVVIGDGAVIAAGAVVTKNVEPYSIVTGIPARHLKFRFSEKHVKDLLSIKWWDWNEEKIKEEMQYMNDIELFIKRHHSSLGNE